MSRRSSLVLVLVAVLALGAVGCSKGEEPTLDVARARRVIAQAVSRQVDLDVSTPTCPATVARKPGTRFRCTASVDGDRLRIQAEVRNERGDLRVELLDAVVRPADVEVDLKARLKQAFDRTFQTDCGAKTVRVVAPGTTFKCDANDSNTHRVVQVTVRDATGALSYSVLPAG